MRAKILIPALLLLAFAAPQHAFAKPHSHAAASKQSTDPNYKFIKSAYDYENYGFVTRDCNRIYSYTTPDFEEIGRNGAKRDKAACLKAMYNTLDWLYQFETQLFAEAKDTHGIQASDLVTRTLTISQFEVRGGVAVVVVTGRLHANVNTTLGDQSRSSEFHEVDGVYRDVWLRSSQGWLKHSSTQVY